MPTSRSALHPDAPLWTWAQDAISHRLVEMFTHTEGVRVGEDIEAVHDMRVGSRRLVAAMKVFAECFPGHEYLLLLREARRVTRRLGAVRDLDVLIDYYTRLRETADSEEALGIDYFIAIHHRKRSEARRPMLAALREIEREDLGGRIGRFLREESEAYQVGLHAPAGRNRRVEPTGSFRDAAPPILGDRLATLCSFERFVEDAEAVEPLHEMRIAAKWLRYTMELFAPAYAGDLKSQIGSVKKVQELLGDLHDSDVRLEILRGMLEGLPDLDALAELGILLPDAVLTSVGLLLAREERVRRGCYEAFRKEWRRLAKKEFAVRTGDRFAAPDAV